MSFYFLMLAYQFSVTMANIISNCITPLGQSSTCIPIHKCTDISVGIQTRDLNDQFVDFLRQSKCGWDELNIPKVCCGQLPSDFKEEGLLHGIEADSEEDAYLPANLECGIQYYEPIGKIFGGSKTEIGQFPWLALLWYQRHIDEKLVHRCGGMLINHRFVLTAAHCIAGKRLEKYGKLKWASLGEHDIRNATDCRKTFCADPPQNIAPLSTYPHPDYIHHSLSAQNDIGLIKLSKRVKYSKFVQPICLDRTGNWAVGNKVYIAGWGKTLKGDFSPVKLSVSLAIADQTSCKKIFQARHFVTLKQSNLCVGGTFSKDSCLGDSGGPAMRRKHDMDTWEAIALISFGYGCGRDGWPAVYTAIAPFYDWILDLISATNTFPEAFF